MLWIGIVSLIPNDGGLARLIPAVFGGIIILVSVISLTIRDSKPKSVDRSKEKKTKRYIFFLSLVVFLLGMAQMHKEKSGFFAVPRAQYE